MDLEIYDATLREGEQAAGANFNLQDRLELFEKLDDFGVDYVEVGWPVASPEILQAFKELKGKNKNSKIVAFGSTSISEKVEEDKNLNSILEAEVEYACIFGKTWGNHVREQLKISKEENLERIRKSVRFLREKGICVFYDAEHYFDGYKEDKDYALETLVSAVEGGATRLILCDTNGGVLPDEAVKIVKETKEKLKERGINVGLGVHFHGDSGLALANTIACLDDIIQVQGTINGIGERIGNLDFSNFLPVYNLKLGKEVKVDLENLKKVHDEAYRLAGIDIPENKPFVGEMAFAHKGGIHIDATNKGASYEHINPKRVGNERKILLNSLGGRGVVVSVAEGFGYNLNKKDPVVIEKIERLFRELRESEARGYNIGNIRAEQFLLIEKYFGNLNDFFKIEKWETTSYRDSVGEISGFEIRCKINGDIIQEKVAVHGGPVDAAYKAMIKILSKKYPEVNGLKLTDFHVRIAKPNGAESSVRTKIDFSDGEVFSTVGVDENIIQSSVEALEKGFRYYLNRKLNKLG